MLPGITDVIRNLGVPLVEDLGWTFRIVTVISLTTGTLFLMWLGDQITERGIGNGISLIITIGIVARLPAALAQAWKTFVPSAQTGTSQVNPAILVLMVAFLFIVIAAVIAITQGVRKITVQYAKRVVGRKMYGGQTQYMPLKVNYAGVMPIIFAWALLLFPTTIVGFAFKNSPTAAKIALFRNLFRGREDVLPRRWENLKTGKAGYAPMCRNEWVRGVCGKPRVKCGECPNQAFIPVGDDIFRSHLAGKTAGNSADFTVGIYPMLPDESCWFLAADFDGHGNRHPCGMLSFNNAHVSPIPPLCLVKGGSLGQRHCASYGSGVRPNSTLLDWPVSP